MSAILSLVLPVSYFCIHEHTGRENRDIKLITHIEDGKVIKKIKAILDKENKLDETDRILANPTMVKRLEESIQQIEEGKGVKVEFTTEKYEGRHYSPEFNTKIKRGEEDIKAGKTTKIEPKDIWDL